MSILLKLYVGTIVFYLISAFTFFLEMRGYKKRNHLIGTYSISIRELIAGFIKLGIIGMFPILNILMGFIYLFSKKLREDIISKLKSKND